MNPYTTLAVLALSLLPASEALAQRTLPIAFLGFDGLHEASNGDVLAAEGFQGSRIFRIAPSGQTQVVAEGLAGPIDMAEDDQGRIYVTTFLDASVYRVDPDGTVTRFAQVLPFPSGIVRDGQGNLLVAHYGVTDPLTGLGTGDTILRIDPQGVVSTFASGGLLAAPVGLALDPLGTLYAGNFHDGQVVAIDALGQQRLLADLTGPEISFAIGHLAYAGGRIYATGIQTQSLYRINPRNGRFRARDIGDRAQFPNGITYRASTGGIVVARGFSPNPDLVQFRVRQY
ncbi:MAG: hypothetical protein AAFZ18_10605 [Myxococcota bacterium]